MSRASVLARGRVAAEAGMVDTCTITRSTVTGVNGQTGAQTIATTTLYTGPCRVHQRVPGGARGTNVGEANLLMLRSEVQLPVSAATDGLQVGDKITITAAVNDPDLTGRVLQIRELAHKSEATARRLGVEEVT